MRNDAITHGDRIPSFQFHPFGPAVFIGVVLDLLIFLADAVQRKHKKIITDGKLKHYALGMTVIVLLLYWGSRLASEWVL